MHNKMCQYCVSFLDVLINYEFNILDEGENENNEYSITLKCSIILIDKVSLYLKKHYQFLILINGFTTIQARLQLRSKEKMIPKDPNSRDEG